MPVQKRVSVAPDGLVLSAHKITKQFKDVTALSQVDLAVRSGRIMGLVGPNGAGKTTLIRILLGNLRPDSGVVLFGPGAGFSPGLDIGAQTDQLGLDPSMTVRQTISYFATIYRADLDQIGAIVDRTDIGSLLKKRVGSMSTGQRRRFEIALALIGDPLCLLFDEPLNGLDPDAIDWFNELVCELRAEEKAILVSSHILHELGKVADEVTILQQGVVRYAGPIQSVDDVEVLYRQTREEL